MTLICIHITNITEALVVFTTPYPTILLFVRPTKIQQLAIFVYLDVRFMCLYVYMIHLCAIPIDLAPL